MKVTKEIKDEGVLPRFSYELIDLLDKMYPHRCLMRGQSQEEALRYAGAREMIDELLDMKREETEGTLGANPDHD